MILEKAGQLSLPVDRVYDGLEQVQLAHDDMEHDRAAGKLVIRVRSQRKPTTWQVGKLHGGITRIYVICSK